MKRYTHYLTIFCFVSSIQLLAQNIVVLDTTNSGIPSNAVTALKFDNNGSLWVGTSDAGLGVFDGSTWTYYNVNNTPQLGSDHISDIEERSNGDMWFATLNGICSKTGSNWTLYDTSLIPNMIQV